MANEVSLDDVRHLTEQHYQSFLQARLAGAKALARLDAAMQARHALLPMPITLRELALLPQLRDASLLALASSPHSAHWSRDDIGATDPAQVLADDAAYADFSRAILEEAAAPPRSHPCRPAAVCGRCGLRHGRFRLLARAARVASYRDDGWFAPVIATLLPQVCVAPGTAKSAPSQSLAMALGHGVETIPTQASVQALRTALDQVRHAGIRKKLERNLKPAEKALRARSALAGLIAVS